MINILLVSVLNFLHCTYLYKNLTWLKSSVLHGVCKNQYKKIMQLISLLNKTILTLDYRDSTIH